MHETKIIGFATSSGETWEITTSSPCDEASHAIFDGFPWSECHKMLTLQRVANTRKTQRT